MPIPIAQGALSASSDDDEQRRLVNLVRGYCALEYRARQYVTTPGNVLLTSIWSQDMPQSRTWRVWADIVGRYVGDGGRATFTRVGLFWRAAGVATQQGAINLITTIASGAETATIIASGSSVVVQVQDAGIAMNWTALVHVDEA